MNMLSRIADSLFWLNRYMERCDGMLRLIHVHHVLSLDRPSSGPLWRAPLKMFTNLENDRLEIMQHDKAGSLRLMLTDAQNPNSLLTIVQRARENARGAQDHLTKEVWEQVNHMYHMITDPALPERLVNEDAIGIIKGFADETVMFAGVTDITMPRGLGWDFMNLGKLIERCHQTLSTISMELANGSDDHGDQDAVLRWRYLLLSLSGYELHLKNYRSQDHTRNMLHQVILNDNFPHSVIYCLKRISHYLNSVMREHEEENTAIFRNFGRLHSRVKFLDLQEMNQDSVAPLLKELSRELADFAKQLSKQYFNYS